MGVEPGLDEDEDEDGVEDGGLNFKQSSRQAHWHRRHRRRISFQTRLRFNVLLLLTQTIRTHRHGLKNHEHS